MLSQICLFVFAVSHVLLFCVKLKFFGSLLKLHNKENTVMSLSDLIDLQVS